MPTFTYGDRVKDPTAELPSITIEARTISVTLLESDLQLLKSLTATRGNIQLTCASLVHSFCTILRSLGITTYLRERDFHLALAVWSGLEVKSCGPSCKPTDPNSPWIDYGDQGSLIESVLIHLPSPAAELIRSALCRGTTPQTSGTEPGTHVTGGTKSVRRKTPRAEKKSTTPPSKGA